MRKSLLLGIGLLIGSSYSSAQDLSTRLFPTASPPPGCQSIPGLFPVGDRTGLIWSYARYAVVMPPYKKKAAQSFLCGAQKGTLYFFEYATEAEKDHALLFAKPVLAKQQGVSHELAIKQWQNGFVLVSFVETSPELMAALDARMGASPVATPKASTQNAQPSTPLVKPTVSPAPVALPLVKIPENVKSSSPVASSTPSLPAEPFAQLKPSISEQPFESSEPAKSIQPIKAAVPSAQIPGKEIPAPTPYAKPFKSPEPIRERPRPIPQAPATSGKFVTAPPAGAADLSSSVLESYASKMGCENTERNSQTQMVCALLQEFASGLPPELPFKADAVLIGPVYTVDSNGRFTDLHYDALTGTHSADVISLFSLPSTGGKDDFEIKQLIEARKAKAPLPENDTSARLPSLSAAKRLGLRTTARSVAIQPAADRRLFIRRAGDHWIVIGVSGASAEAQLNTSLAVGVLY